MTQIPIRTYFESEVDSARRLGSKNHVGQPSFKITPSKKYSRKDLLQSLMTKNPGIQIAGGSLKMKAQVVFFPAELNSKNILVESWPSYDVVIDSHTKNCDHVIYNCYECQARG